MQFDAREAKLLKPGQHLVVGGCPGLRLEVTATTKTWTYRYEVDRRMKQIKLGHWPAMSVLEAAKAWQAKRSEREPGVALVKPTQAPVVRSCTVADVVMNYVTGHLEVERSAKSATAAERRMRTAIVDMADKPAESVTRLDAYNLLDQYKHVPTSAGKLKSELGAAWDLGLETGMLDAGVPNWWRIVMKGKLKSKGKIIAGEHQGQTRRLLKPDELTALMAWMSNMHDLAKDCVVMYLWTVTRGSEFLGIQPDHISQEPTGWWWTCPKEATKSARFADAVDLRVPLYGRALEVIKRRMANVGASGFLFENAKGEQYTQHTFSTYIYDLQPYSAKTARREGEGLVCPVINWTPHNLRRTARTMLAGLGCPNEVGEAIMGHLPPDIVATYNAHTYDDERQHWLKLLSKRLESL